MGRAVAMLMDRELLSVFGEHTAGEWPVFAQQATEELEYREAKMEAREHKVDSNEARMRERSEGLRHREDDLEAREQQAELVSKLASRHSTARTKIGRTNAAPAGRVSSTSAATVWLATEVEMDMGGSPPPTDQRRSVEVVLD